MIKLINEYLANKINDEKLVSSSKEYFLNNYVTLNSLNNIYNHLNQIGKKQLFDEIYDQYLISFIDKKQIDLVTIFDCLNLFGCELSKNLAIQILADKTLMQEYENVSANNFEHLKNHFNKLDDYYNFYLKNRKYNLNDLKRIYSVEILDDDNAWYGNKLYQRQIRKIPILEKDDEISLFIRKNLGDKEAFEYLVISNLRLAASIATSIYQKNNFLNLEHLIQNANLALCSAINTFNLNKGCKFSTYATTIIKRYVNREMNKDDLIKLSEYLKNSAKTNLDLIEQAKEPMLSLDESFYKDSDDEVKLVDEISNEQNLFQHVDSLETIVLDKIILDGFFANIDHLSEIEQKLIYYIYVEKMSVPECIKLLDLKVSRQAVEQRLAKIKSNLKTNDNVKKLLY